MIFSVEIPKQSRSACLWQIAKKFALLIASLKDESARKELITEAVPEATASLVANSLSLREIKERIKAATPQPQKQEIFNRVDNVSKQIRKSKKLILENSRKRKKLESL